MNLNMKFYVISIVAIFAALGIGIYIGFTLDAQSFVLDQREDIASKLEERFDFLKAENDDLKSEINELENINSNNKTYIENTYESLIDNKLSDRNILVFETNDDYMYSSLAQTISQSGGNLAGFITIKAKALDEEFLKEFYENNSLEANEEIRKDLINKISHASLNQDQNFLDLLKKEGIVDYRGSLLSEIDAVILAGGSLKDSQDNIAIIDKTIIDVMKVNEIDIVGIEKLGVNNSYMESYKNYKISTVDNIDTTEGKVSLVFALNGYPGNYGVKTTSEALVPKLSPVKNEFEVEENKND